MLIKCRVCGKEFEKRGHRNRHEIDAHWYKPGKSPRIKKDSNHD